MEAARYQYRDHQTHIFFSKRAVQGVALNTDIQAQPTPRIGGVICSKRFEKVYDFIGMSPWKNIFIRFSTRACHTRSNSVGIGVSDGDMDCVVYESMSGSIESDLYDIYHCQIQWVG